MIARERNKVHTTWKGRKHDILICRSYDTICRKSQSPVPKSTGTEKQACLDYGYKVRL